MTLPGLTSKVKLRHARGISLKHAVRISHTEVLLLFNENNCVYDTFVGRKSGLDMVPNQDIRSQTRQLSRSTWNQARTRMFQGQKTPISPAVNCGLAPGFDQNAARSLAQTALIFYV